MSEKAKYFYAFSTDERFSVKFSNLLYDYFGDIEAAWNGEISELLKVEGLSKKKIIEFNGFRNSIDVDKIYSDFLNSENKFITIEDYEYPSLLKEIHNPPLWLFYRGNINILNTCGKKMAVVGSRRASITAKNVLTKILSEFENTDLCVVSGMADGIDTTAHQAALKYNLPTIAVLGSGLENIYPIKNTELFNSIINSKGLVLSEFPPKSPPIKYHFPLRNRIVSGISDCTLVAEATLKSGALITAGLCLEQNRELMCIPGAINNPGTEGIYKLLKNGAGIVTCGDDILNNMNWHINKFSKSSEQNDIFQNLSDDEKIVADLLRRDTLTIDELSYKTNFSIDTLMLILTNLELQDIITQIEGEKYSIL